MTAPADHEADPTTRLLLLCGVVAGPLFVVMSFAQAFSRTGFDLRRHPFSMLSLGELGWIQVLVFVISGVLFIACAVGMRRVLRHRRGGTWGPALIGAFGLAQIGGGVFVTDPALGFPPGAPSGVPESFSWQSTVHGIAFALGMISLIAAFAVFARAFSAVGAVTWSRYSLATGVAFVALGGLGSGLGDWRLVAGAVLFGWSWAALAARRLRSSLTGGAT